MFLMKTNKELGSSYDNSGIQHSENLEVHASKVVPFAQYPPFWPVPYYPYFEYLYADQYLPYMHPYGLPFLPTQFTNQPMRKKTEPQIIKIQESQQELVIQLEPFTIQKQVEKVEEKKEFSKEESFLLKKQDIPEEPSLPNQESSQPFVSSKFVNDLPKNLKAKEHCLQNLLNNYFFDPVLYQNIVREKTEKNSLFSQVVKIFNTKITTFKKSKEEMIKIIIRKTQRYYKTINECKRDQRFKKYGGFKSMNSVYLEKLFSDTQFVNCFNEVVSNFMKEFEEENHLKLITFLGKVAQAQTWQEMKVALISIEQKNKMPWPRYWITKFQNVISELQSTYIQHNQSKIPTKPKKKY